MSLKAGDIIYSPFFGKNLTIIEITSDYDWKFEIDGQVAEAQTPLSYFEERPNLKVTKDA